MAELPGRLLRIKYNSGSGAVVIAKARSDNLTVALEPIDISSKDDGGNHTLLDDIGKRTFSGTVEGILSDATLINLVNAAGAGTSLHDFEIEVAGIGTWAGKFFISNFEVAGAEGPEAATFSCAITGSGVIGFTAAS